MLRQAGCIKRALNTAGLTLQADAGESFLVKAIYVGKVDTDGYLAAKIDNVSVAYYRVAGKRGNKLGGIRYEWTGINLMDLLVKRGLPFSLPIAEGQKLSIAALDGIGSIQVVYDTYDAGDINAAMPNGTECKTFGFIQDLRETTVIAASGDMLLDKSNTPAEFPDFPAGKAVPANMKIILHAIEGSPFSDHSSGSNGFYTTFLKLIRGREVLLDEDRNGIPFLGLEGGTWAQAYKKTESLIGSVGEQSTFNDDYKQELPLFFDPPLEFITGEELNIYLTLVKVGTHTLAANTPEVNLILEVVKK